MIKAVFGDKGLLAFSPDVDLTGAPVRRAADGSRLDRRIIAGWER